MSIYNYCNNLGASRGDTVARSGGRIQADQTRNGGTALGGQEK